jgi:hypothetical protein
MSSQYNNMVETFIPSSISFNNKSNDELLLTETSTQLHLLSDKWTLWAHLPHNIDWTLKSYIPISTFSSVEDCIAITETLPNILIENCMLFIMKQHIKPIWEDNKNRNGGCFSYKILNKNVYNVWKELTYLLIGGTLSNNINFVKNINGITISPKKNFCIIKVWMATCEFQNPALITNIKNLTNEGCLFKKHLPEY